MTDRLDALNAALGTAYRIEREIGAGGMATVYLAHDTKHDRKVALKVLKPELAAVIGAERFLAEIRTTANLQHPHILALFDSGQVDGTVYYVMPFVGGESLRDRLTRDKQLPVEEAVRLAREVADALQHAHEHDVIHRDIKPENILVHGGHALVVDFGIALAASKTGGTRMTETGMSLGTPTYMSPEQAMGERTLDARTDVYALGCVLYEMLLGEAPFTGPTAQAIVARVLTEEPRSPTLQRKSIPPHVERAVLTALAKLPADRFATAAQFAAALEGRDFAYPPGAARSTRVAAEPTTIRRSTRLLVAGSLAAAVLIAAAGAWAWLHPRGSDPELPVRFVLTLPAGTSLLGGPGSDVLLSPDGRTLVYGTQASGSSLLYRRDVGRIVPTAIAGTERAVLPFISHDGKWVAFFNGNQLKKVPLDGGPAAVIATVAQSHGASWGPNNIIVLGAYPGVEGLSRIAATDGQLLVFAKPDTAKGEVSQRWPRVLADGKTVLYTSWGSGGLQTARIGIASLETGKSAILTVVGTYPLGVFEGQMIYARADGALMAATIDIGARRVSGEPVALESGVTLGARGSAKVALSEHGMLAYVTGSSTSRLVLVGTTGVVRPLLRESRDFDTPRRSPDGRFVAVSINARPPDIWVVDIAAGTLTRLTSEGQNVRPEWTPDGKRIVFVSNRSGEMGVWWRAVDGSAPPRKVFESRDDALEAAVAPSGGILVYRANQSGGNYGLAFRSLEDFTSPKAFFTTSNSHELMPSVSPDGRWLAYVSDETGAAEVYIRPFPGPGARYLVSASGGSEPRWAPDGRQLFYRNGRKMLVARVSTVPALSVSGRDELFEGNYATNAAHQNYDVTRDGQGFYMLQRDADVEVVIVLNWLTELRARLRGSVSK